MTQLCRMFKLLALSAVIATSLLACNYRQLGAPSESIQKSHAFSDQVITVSIEKNNNFDSNRNGLDALDLNSKTKRAAQPIEKQLANKLSSQGYTLANDPFRFNHLLLNNENTGQLVSAVNLAGDVIEYRRFHRITMQVISQTGETLLPPQIIVAERRYRFDETRLLASQAEATRIAKALSEELSDRITLRLNAILMLKAKQS